jgi:transposase-like protein
MEMAKGADKSRERRWRALIARQVSSGQSVRAFCRGEGLAESAFYFWRRELRQREGQARPALLPLSLVAESPRAPLELELPGGAVLRIGAEAPRELLAQLLGALLRERDGC